MTTETELEQAWLFASQRNPLPDPLFIKVFTKGLNISQTDATLRTALIRLLGESTTLAFRSEDDRALWILNRLGLSRQQWAEFRAAYTAKNSTAGTSSKK
jgi:hypothetical protein